MRTRILAGLAVLMLCIALPCPATVYYHIHEALMNTTGEALTGTTYYLYTPNTEDTTAVYSDRAGTAAYQGSGNFQTGADGMIDVYVTAGCYDIYYSHSGWSITGTLEDYCRGIADSIGTSSAIDANYVTADSITIEGTGTNAQIRFGAVLDSTMNANWFIPKNHSQWVRRSGGTARRQDAEYDYCFGIGASSVQFEERSSIDWAFGDADHATGGYDDRSVLYLDSTNADSTATDSDAYQAVILANTRADSSQWMMGGVKGVRGFWQGTPDYGIRLETDIPDSAGATGYRDAVQVRWWLTDGKPRIYSEYSTFLNILEHDTSHYKFRQKDFVCYSEHEEEKRISIKGARADTTASAWTHLMNDHLQTELRCNSATLAILDFDASDDATLKVANATISDMFKFPVISLASAWPTDIGPGSAFMSTGDTLYIRNNADNAWNSWTKD